MRIDRARHRADVRTCANNVSGCAGRFVAARRRPKYNGPYTCRWGRDGRRPFSFHTIVGQVTAVIAHRRCCAVASATCVIAVVGAAAFAVAGDAVADVGSAEPNFDAAAVEFFEQRVRPLLAGHCHDCHGPKKQEGGLRLDSRAAVLRGGDSGPTVVPHEPDASLLIDAVRYGDVYQMPPTEQLPPGEIAVLEEWVRRGAPWPTDDPVQADVNTTAVDIVARKRSHWAWRPIVSPAVPATRDGQVAATAIDAFLLAKLAEAGIERAAPADKPTLIRRATFDLLGLPPTPEEVDAFVADLSPDAFRRLVDRLLASPHFGERWGRHWLDLVRYAETLGHEFDYPITNAWHYRDYVIRALNADVPYDQFVREHIAGDLLEPPRLHPSEGYNESVIGTAFWYLGEAMHAPVDSRADRAVRLENQIDVFSKTFLGMTVACARCHDHKFDAITTRDYYALAGYLTSSHQQQTLLDPQGRIASGYRRLSALQERGREAWTAMLPTDPDAAGDAFARGLLAVRASHGVNDAARLDAIAHAHGMDRAMLDRFRATVAGASAQGSGHPLRVWAMLAGGDDSDESFLTRRSAFEAAAVQQRGHGTTAAQTEAVFEDFSADFDRWFPAGWAFGERPTRPGDWQANETGARLLPGGLAHSGRYGAKMQGVLRSATFTIEQPYILYRLCGRNARVRLVVDGYMMDDFTPLLFEGLSFNVDMGDALRWHSQSVAKFLGHRAHIELIDAGDGYLAVDEIRFAEMPTADRPDGPIDSWLLALPNVDSARALAGAYARIWAQGVADWQKERTTAASELVRWALESGLLPIGKEVAAELVTLDAEVDAVNSQLPSPEKVVAITDGSSDDQPVQIRGNHKVAGEVVPRRLLEAIAGAAQKTPARGSGRLDLAERLLAADNPLAARVMVNRVWQHLFGRGIVATVDNFGVLGEPPTHAELLDYLAADFRAEGWSVKRLIREILLSDAYQLASESRTSAEERDPLNLLLHRANVRRLEGEVIRDALLAISGRLDAKQFGPPVPIHLTPFMEGRGRPKQSGPLDGDGRRTIYVEVRRNFLSPFMLAFDTPQPASAVGRRNVSNVPAQALTLMNDAFVVEQCRLWAERALVEQDATAEERIQRLYRMAFGRPPSDQELSDATAFVSEQAAAYDGGPSDVRPWADLCHVLVNVKEFVFVK